MSAFDYPAAPPGCHKVFILIKSPISRKRLFYGNLYPTSSMSGLNDDVRHKSYMDWHQGIKFTSLVIK